ncbi:MAG TPA: adenylate/guanylate cyclase domain-containing protein [Tepidisphaeraceae bacterium]|jgi:class 3 adenylate cyclase
MLAFLSGLPILPAMSALLSLLMLVVASITLVLRIRGGGEPACGNCGYRVRGLPSFTCPECGSDLRQVGIVSSAGGGNPLLLFARALASVWKLLLLYTLALVALTILLTYASIALILNHDVFPNQEVVLDPASKGYRLTLNQVGDLRHASGSLAAGRDKVFGNKLVLQLAQPNQAPDHNSDFRVDLGTWSSYLYHWTDGVSPTLPPTPFNRGQLERFFKEKNIDATAPAVSAEIDSLMLLIDACRNGPLLRLAPAAQRFTVASAANKSSAQLNSGGTAPGMFFLGLASNIWMPAISATIIARMFKLARKPAPPSASAGPTIVTPPPGPADHVARTVTILFSDIKDFTARSAAASRAGAIDLARRHRELAAPVLRQRRGNLVKTMGDALLVTFDSATDAVLAGLEIQAAARAKNLALPGDDQLKLRIAVATGEVIVEAGDVYGETVNLAARLQSIATPGQVVLSGATRTLVNAREVYTKSFGEHQLAGFASPIHAYVATPVPDPVPD